MIDIELARKRAADALERAEKATDGPWCAMNYNAIADMDQRRSVAAEMGFSTGKWTTYGKANDAAFIAEARSDVPDLAQSLLQALEEIERLKDRLQPFVKAWEQYDADDRGEHTAGEFITDDVWEISVTDHG